MGKCEMAAKIYLEKIDTKYHFLLFLFVCKHDFENISIGRIFCK